MTSAGNRKPAKAELVGQIGGAGRRRRTPEVSLADDRPGQRNSARRNSAVPTPSTRVHLVQERIDLEQERAAGTNGVDLEGLEAEFVAAAAAYGHRNGISYDAWRAAGVEPRVLRAAGIGRGQ
jgi:hypothetical protein